MDLRVNVESIFRNENANVACLHFNHMLRQLRHITRPRYACNITSASRGTRVSRSRARSKYELSSLLVNYCLILKVSKWRIRSINHLATQIHVNSVTNFSSYFTDKTQCLHYNDQSVDAVVGNDGCLFYETYETTRTVWAERGLEQVALTTEV